MFYTIAIFPSKRTYTYAWFNSGAGANACAEVSPSKQFRTALGYIRIQSIRTVRRHGLLWSQRSNDKYSNVIEFHLSSRAFRFYLIPRPDYDASS